MRPVLDPQRDLAGATPETLARALLRPLRLPPDNPAPDSVQESPSDYQQDDSDKPVVV